MNRRTNDRGGAIRHLVVMGLLVAFCLTLFGSTAQAYSRDQVKTKTAVLSRGSEDPGSHDDAHPSIFIQLRTWIGIFLGHFGDENKQIMTQQKNETSQPTTSQGPAQ